MVVVQGVPDEIREVVVVHKGDIDRVAAPPFHGALGMHERGAEGERPVTRGDAHEELVRALLELVPDHVRAPVTVHVADTRLDTTGERRGLHLGIQEGKRAGRRRDRPAFGDVVIR